MTDIADKILARGCDCCAHPRSNHDIDGCNVDWAGMWCPCAVSWGIDG